MDQILKNKIIGQIRQIYQEADKIQVKNIACGWGCGICCTHPVLASNFEAELIAAKLKNEYETINSWKVELEAWRKLAMMAFGGYLDAFKKLVTRQFRSSLSEADFICLKLIIESYMMDAPSCPFLDKNTEICIVYEVRPVNCRLFVSGIKCKSAYQVVKFGVLYPEQQNFFKQRFAEIQKGLNPKDWRTNFMPVLVLEALNE